MPKQTWAAVEPFVLGCAARLDLAEDRNALRTVRVLAKVAAWCASEGIPLEQEAVLDPATVERFITVALAGDRSRSTYRAVLRRVGPLLTTTAPWSARPVPIYRQATAPPYSAEEMRLLAAATRSQPTPGRRRAARALIALGAGAGLDGRWMAWVGPADVAADEHGMRVRVGDPWAREVPVLVEWQDEVLVLASTAGTDFLVGGKSQSKNRSSQLISRLVIGHDQPKVSLARLRSTWLVRHLEMGSRLPELTAAAGLADTRILSDLVGHVPPMAATDAARMLQGQR